MVASSNNPEDITVLAGKLCDPSEIKEEPLPNWEPAVILWATAEKSVFAPKSAAPENVWASVNVGPTLNSAPAPNVFAPTNVASSKNGASLKSRAAPKSMPEAKTIMSANVGFSLAVNVCPVANSAPAENVKVSGKSIIPVKSVWEPNVSPVGNIVPAPNTISFWVKSWSYPPVVKSCPAKNFIPSLKVVAPLKFCLPIVEKSWLAANKVPAPKSLVPIKLWVNASKSAPTPKVRAAPKSTPPSASPNIIPLPVKS